MARISASALAVALVVLTACAAPVKPPAAPPAAPPATHPVLPPAPPPPPVRAAPRRPALLWPVTKLHDTDYVSVRDLAARFDLKAAWSKSDLTMTLRGAGGVRFLFETNQRDIFFDGLRVFLGQPVVFSKDSLWVSLLDVIKIVAPLYRPEDRTVFLPANEPRTIVLDPGHGGADPGTQNQTVGIDEKSATLDVALRLRKILEARQWRVLMVRAEDKELSRKKVEDLLLRDEFANTNKADLFLSIHFNHAVPAVRGVETYWLPPQFMLSSGDETGDTMTKVAYPGNRLDNANLMFGEKIHRAMISRLKAPDRGFKHGRLAVLRMLECPGALVECAFLSNDAEARRVTTPAYRQEIAEALADGVQSYATALAALRPAAIAPK